MHIEIQVALNFVISYLFNKLPRRRVNLFGEELDRALKLKFEGHWYPEKPFKGSAYRCLRAGTPLDPVIQNAARESGLDLLDIRENLPEELSIWIDPGEVSYRIGEKGSVKILYVDECSLSPKSQNSCSSGNSSGDDSLEKELGRSFNPEAQCFKPIESLASALGNLAVTASSASSMVSTNNNNNNNNGRAGSPTFNGSTPTSIYSGGNSPSPNSFKNINNKSPVMIHNNNNNINNNNNNMNNNNNAAAATVVVTAAANNGNTTNNVNVGFVVGGKHVTPLTFTTATFAQTKFGSTKLKSNSKRSNRMSPTEFSNYIKQRAMLQQQQQQQQSSMFINGPLSSSPQPQRPRSLSPINLLSPADQQHFVFMANNGGGGVQQQHHQQQFNGLFDNSYMRDLIVVNNTSNAPSSQQHGGGQQQHLAKFSAADSTAVSNGDNGGVGGAAASPFLMTGINDNSKTILDGINFNLNNMPYSSQHLLVAN